MFDYVRLPAWRDGGLCEFVVEIASHGRLYAIALINSDPIKITREEVLLSVSPQFDGACYVVEIAHEKWLVPKGPWNATLGRPATIDTMRATALRTAMNAPLRQMMRIPKSQWSSTHIWPFYTFDMGWRTKWGPTGPTWEGLRQYIKVPDRPGRYFCDAKAHRNRLFVRAGRGTKWEAVPPGASFYFKKRGSMFEYIGTLE